MLTSAHASPEFRFASDNSLLIYFDQHISLDAHHRVAKFLRLLELHPVSGIVNLHPAYCSVLIKFECFKLRHDELEILLRPYLDRMDDEIYPTLAIGKSLSAMASEFGPDLQEVSDMHHLSTKQAIDLHVSASYIVYFLGFVPGFAYLGELPDELVTPRLLTPRRKVPPGSVGIAGHQSGVYPFDTPGGWRLIGRTPLAMFRPDRAAMSFLSIGDRVHFTPISPAQFAALENS